MTKDEAQRLSVALEMLMAVAAGGDMWTANWWSQEDSTGCWSFVLEINGERYGLDRLTDWHA